MGKHIAIDEIGNRYGRLRVIRRVPNDKKRAKWECICDCGKTISVIGDSLRTGNTKSCGCLHRETLLNIQTTHDKKYTFSYVSWENMKSRCNNPNRNGYKDYGGRGITVCKRWDKFENFYEDMGDRPKGMTLERTDNEGDYSPNNCTWATHTEQSRNSRHNVMIKYQGKTQCMSVWAEELGINYKALWFRLQKYPPQIAFNM